MFKINVIRFTIVFLLMLLFSCKDNDPIDVIDDDPIPSKPTLSGETIVGKTLTATVEAAPDGYDRVIQWYRNSTVVSGVIETTYVLSSVDVGNRISIGVYFKKGNRKGKEVKSDATAPIKDNVDKSIPIPLKPTLSGETVVGKTLTATVESAPDGYNRVILWYRDNRVIPDENGINYELNWADLDSKISVGVYFTKGDKKGKEVKSDATEFVKSGRVGSFVVKDPMYNDQWYLKNVGQGNGTVGLDINVEPVWNLGYLGQGVNVAVSDELVDANHPDLKSNIALVKNYSSLGNTCTKNHGTPAAGIIAAKNNDIGTVGIAPSARIYVFNVFNGDGDMLPNDKLSEVLSEDVRELAVYNSSWGTTGGAYDSKGLKLHDGIDKGIREGFYGKGLCYVFSAGNAVLYNISGNLELAHPGVISVAGVDKKGNKVFGAAVFGAQHWISAFVDDILTTDRTDRVSGQCGYAKGNYYRFSGTSAAAPIVSGVVALIRQANPLLTYRDVKLILAETASREKLPNTYKWNETGSTYTDSSKKYAYSKWLGFGIVDAYAAVKMAKKWTLLPPQKVEEYTHSISRIPIIKNEEKEIEVSIKGSNINFVESIQLIMKFESNEEHSTRIGLKVQDPTGTEFEVCTLRRYFGVIYKGEDTFVNAYNLYLGKHNPNGVWKIKITVTDDNTTAIKDVKIKVYGH